MRSLAASKLCSRALPPFEIIMNRGVISMTVNTFPAIGHVYQADYRERAYRVAFDTDGKTLRWAQEPVADFDRDSVTETYKQVPVRPGVFMVTWQEADGITVTHVEDFENGIVHAAITLPDHTFLNLKGTWTPLS
jgi:hypothetical protein